MPTNERRLKGQNTRRAVSYNNPLRVIAAMMVLAHSSKHNFYETVCATTKTWHDLAIRMPFNVIYLKHDLPNGVKSRVVVKKKIEETLGELTH